MGHGRRADCRPYSPGAVEARRPARPAALWGAIAAFRRPAPPGRPRSPPAGAPVSGRYSGSEISATARAGSPFPRRPARTCRARRSSTSCRTRTRRNGDRLARPALPHLLRRRIVQRARDALAHRRVRLGPSVLALPSSAVGRKARPKSISFTCNLSPSRRDQQVRRLHVTVQDPFGMGRLAGPRPPGRPRPASPPATAGPARRRELQAHAVEEIHDQEGPGLAGVGVVAVPQPDDGRVVQVLQHLRLAEHVGDGAVQFGRHAAT